MSLDDSKPSGVPAVANADCLADSHVEHLAQVLAAAALSWWQKQRQAELPVRPVAPNQDGSHRRHNKPSA